MNWTEIISIVAIACSTLSAIFVAWRQNRAALDREEFKVAMDDRLVKIRAELDKELEKAKLDLEKSRRIHELQFTTEFEVYKQLWPAISNALVHARDVFICGDRWINAAQNNIQTATLSLNKASEMLHCNEVFIPPDAAATAFQVLQGAFEAIDHAKHCFAQCKALSLCDPPTAEVKNTATFEKNMNEARDRLQTIIRTRIDYKPDSV